MRTCENIQFASNSSLASLQKIETKYENIQKSEEDKRLYRGLKLENGIRVLLVSDPTTDKSACCLSCEVSLFLQCSDVKINQY